MSAAGSSVSRAWRWRPNPLAGLVLGTSVVIEDGVLQGLRGVVLGIDRRERVIVAITLLRCVIAVELEPDGVRIERPPVCAPLVH
jgi:hypothetical protein